jgi:hypothetical protein
MSWFEPLREAIRLYNEGHGAECIAQVETILSNALSPYPRIRCHVLLAYALDDWYEVDVTSALSSQYVPSTIITRLTQTSETAVDAFQS